MLRLEFGNGALGIEDRGAMFKVIGGLCNTLFGVENPNQSLRSTVEKIDIDGVYVKLSRLIVRNSGCVIGSLVELDYFSPENEPYNERLADLDEIEPYDEDDASYIGRHVCMTFDTSDGSFFKSESLSRLSIDHIGEADLEEVNVFDIVDDTLEDEDFSKIISNEAATPTINDYFTVNTGRAIMVHKYE